ncbi:MAG: hypothetical protein QW063_02590 [Candidatus Nanoarchaeia archaeon]
MAIIAPFDAVIQLLQDFGFFRVVLPFLLIFAIIYAILIKTKVLGDPALGGIGKTAPAIVALVVAFLVIVYSPVVDALALLLPNTAFVLVLIVFLLMILGMFGIEFQAKAGEKMPLWAIAIMIIVFVLFLALIGFAAPQIGPLHTFAQILMGAIPIEIEPDVINLLIGAIIVLSIVGIVLYFIK